jgi:arylsulfatase A-like enzyme
MSPGATTFPAVPERRPNVLVLMTDEERYPPPYEAEALAQFRKDHLPARQRLRDEGLEMHRHYAGSAACLPSRATLFTGQYPSLHGVSQTDGLTKQASDPGMSWLDPNTVPTMGDWFRAAGYRTFYKGKWHISHADLLVPGTHDPVPANRADGTWIPEGLDAYRRADRLDPYGFSGWIGPEPHGAAGENTGWIRDELFAEEVEGLFAELVDGRDADDRPWLAVASLVNPHDIAFSGLGWKLLGFPLPDDTIPDVPEAPSQRDDFSHRPTAQAQFKELWPRMLYPQEPDLEYRRFYHFLHVSVDRAMARILDALDRSGMAEDTYVVFTSDHGDMLGAHGGMQQKWHSGFDEAQRVPLVIRGPEVDTRAIGLDLPTSHVDLLPTLLALVGAEAEQLAPVVAEHHVEVQPFPGRDLSELVRGAPAAGFDHPVYFMTEDQISRGLRHENIFTGKPYDAVQAPDKVESVIAHLETGPDGEPELWKLNRYYEVLDPADARADGGAADGPPPADDQWELHNLTLDPEERTNRADADAQVADLLRQVLDTQRTTKRLTPQHVSS